MSNALDTLDDLIKNSKRSGSRARNNNIDATSAPGVGPARRRFPNRSGNRTTTPYSTAAPKLLRGQTGAGRYAAIETGTKLYISNLDYDVSNDDIKELFSEVGELKRYSVDYDRSGRSKGTAEVVYSQRADALVALKRYDNVQLDRKAMKLETADTSIAPPAALPPAINGFFGKSNGFNRRRRHENEQGM